MYDLTFSFWSLLTTEKAELAGGRALLHSEVPYLLSNAAWYPQPGRLKSVAEWYAARGLPPALVVPALRDHNLERTLQDGPFELERAFIFREAEPQPEHAEDVVEQVGWTQTRYAGELLASFYGQGDLSIAVAKSVAKAMQDTPAVQTFLAYEKEPVGVMVAFEQENVLSAMLLVESGGLEYRLAQEATARGLRGFVLEALPEGITLRSEMSLERWSIR